MSSPKKRRKAAQPTPEIVYQLKITLKNVKPSVWRRVLVPDCTLDDLHEIIQIAMGWENCHLYSFTVGPEEFTRPDMDEEGMLEMRDSTEYLISDLIAAEKEKFQYEYDFGDGWEHTITVEKIGPPEAAQTYPVCVKGKHACPPEDVGGPWGFAEYLEAMADPSHERHSEFTEWSGEFDAAAFDLDAVNKQLRAAFR